MSNDIRPGAGAEIFARIERLEASRAEENERVRELEGQLAARDAALADSIQVVLKLRAEMNQHAMNATQEEARREDSERRMAEACQVAAHLREQLLRAERDRDDAHQVLGEKLRIERQFALTMTQRAEQSEQALADLQTESRAANEQSRQRDAEAAAMRAAIGPALDEYIVRGEEPISLENALPVFRDTNAGRAMLADLERLRAENAELRQRVELAEIESSNRGALNIARQFRRIAEQGRVGVFSDAEIEAAAQAIDGLRIERDAMKQRTEAAEAKCVALREDLEETLGYVDSYFKEKWDLGRSLRDDGDRFRELATACGPLPTSAMASAQGPDDDEGTPV